MPSILVTGACGQIGSELVPALRARYGHDAVVATDLEGRIEGSHLEGPLRALDCTHIREIEHVVRHHAIEVIYHLAGLLSAVAEARPRAAWDVNMGGLYRILEVAREHGASVFFPSSIGAFGPSTPHDATPQVTIQRPNTIYGITKLSGELLCDYYAQQYGLDTRGLRLPGIISHVAPPGGGTTDYAVDMFHHAVEGGRYTCFLRGDSCLDMMYMPDALRAMMALMDADRERLEHRNAYNITAMSFTPQRLADEIRKHISEFHIDYEVDPVRQAIADSWPNSLDDSAARQEWGWRPQWDIETMTRDMLEHVRNKRAGS
ncbi:MAG: NAD-dependent epimerase/dehydratase family protein [Myxococcales bacterium]|nr:NAD-dependent epimerase/dehydratase family protein [Myxococcales bacterium]